MKKIQLLNAFSLNMLKRGSETLAAYNPTIREIELDEVKELLTDSNELGFESAIGHADTANVFSSQLGLEVPFNRASVELEKGDIAVVGQYTGPRLQEGATELPEGAVIVWWLVSID